MFRAQPAGSAIEATPNRIVSLHRCLNSSPIALAGGPAIPSRAHVVGVYNDNGTYTLYLVLTPVTGAQGILFLCDPRQVPLANYRVVEREALELVEAQGFVMEPVELKALPPAEVQNVLRELPLAAPQVGAPTGAFPRGGAPADAGGMARPRTGSVPRAAAPAPQPAAPQGVANQSRSGLYALPPQQRPAFSSRPAQPAHAAPPPQQPPAAQLRRSPTASFGRPPRTSAPAPTPTPQPTVHSGMHSLPPGGRPAARHAPGQNIGTLPGVPGHTSDELGMPPEEAIALLGRLLALF